ncbi:3-(3-hydroxy-phenyl)propionate hydroxylase [Pararobbsia alpina]|uniref:bifunctional 3-(3-hydroxy-phenyl)propionate/3-hydroxycinnamic acid hydroxylase MhpA n=1 Tax=Pararobbsia alpina TaxID=621374 RepID=UPI0039A4B59B
MGNRIFDVVIVGMGPVGLTLAATLAKQGRPVAVVEKHANLYGMPRAGHIDHEIVRILQSLDAAAPVLADSYPTVEYIWKNALGETLLEFDWGAKAVSGYNSDYMQYQPLLEDALFSRIANQPHVTLYRGWEAAEFVDTPEGVEALLFRTELAEGAHVPTRTDHSERITGRYLVGADGANSVVRRWLGIERDDLGFNEKWLDVDARKKREFQLDFDCGQICDPKRPVTVLPLGKRHRRWEWAMLPGETREELERPETAWRLLAEQGVSADDVEIVRQIVYTFEARIAREWRRGHTFLVGDAAHTMPPFQGQGMCSGMRDAVNLAWKIDAVLKGVCDDALLDTYQQERYPHVYDWTIISIESGKVPCTLDPAIADARDAKFRSGWRPPMPDFPKLNFGVIGHDRSGALMPIAGQLSLQATVQRGSRTGLFDDLFPHYGYTIVSLGDNAERYLSAAQLQMLDMLGTQYVKLGATGDDDADAVDVEGRYAEFFEQHGIEVMIVRPDFYVFAGCALADLGEAIDDLQHRAAMRVNRAAATTNTHAKAVDRERAAQLPAIASEGNPTATIAGPRTGARLTAPAPGSVFASAVAPGASS